MWVTVALLTTLQLAPQPVGQLKLTNDRVTHNSLGWERADSKNPKLYPGDLLFVIFDIEGLPVGDDGSVRYSIGMELRDDKANKALYTKEPEAQQVTASLGGKRLAASAQATIGTDTKPGTYTMKVTVIDPINKKTETLSRSFEVIPPALGFARIIPSYDKDSLLLAPPVLFPGQSIFVSFAVVGFTLDNKNQPNLSVKMRVVDQATKEPVLKQPFAGNVAMAPDEFKKIFPMQFILSLNRPGKFKIVLELTDNLTKKTVEQTLDFEVLEAR